MSKKNIELCDFRHQYCVKIVRAHKKKAIQFQARDTSTVVTNNDNQSIRHSSSLIYSHSNLAKRTSNKNSIVPNSAPNYKVSHPVLVRCVFDNCTSLIRNHARLSFTIERKNENENAEITSSIVIVSWPFFN